MVVATSPALTARASLVARGTTKAVTTFRAPKVQIWDRRNQMKLSGKRTLFSTNSGKFVLLPQGDTDGESLVG